MDMRCAVCKRTPDDLSEYIFAANEENITPAEYVEREEGTFNRKTGAFYCTSCYIKIGMPLGTA